MCGFVRVCTFGDASTATHDPEEEEGADKDDKEHHGIRWFVNKPCCTCLFKEHNCILSLCAYLFRFNLGDDLFILCFCCFVRFTCSCFCSPNFFNYFYFPPIL